MFIDNFKEYISVEKRFSKNTVISYLQDLNQFFKDQKINTGNININVRSYISHANAFTPCD